MSIFGISDLHLPLGADKPMDIFRGWDDYVERIENNWCKMITDYDYVVIPGDISWALKLSETYNDFKFIDKLPGKKIILKGNHDLWWSTMNKMNTFLEENNFNSISFIHNSCYEIGEYAICGSRGWFFDDNSTASKKVILREATRLDVSIKTAKELNKTPLVFLHYPVCFNNQVCEELFEVLQKHEIKDVWHGHIHGSGKQYITSEYMGICFHLISCDCINFSPILIK